MRAPCPGVRRCGLAPRGVPMRGGDVAGMLCDASSMKLHPKASSLMSLLVTSGICPRARPWRRCWGSRMRAPCPGVGGAAAVLCASGPACSAQRTLPRFDVVGMLCDVSYDFTSSVGLGWLCRNSAAGSFCEIDNETASESLEFAVHIGDLPARSAIRCGGAAGTVGCARLAQLWGGAAAVMCTVGAACSARPTLLGGKCRQDAV